MDISNFISGNSLQQYEYKSFNPSPINLEWIVTQPEINTLLSEANLKLGELNAFSQYVPDVDFFISMHLAKEATLSSRIEGTQTNIEEAFIKLEDINPEKRDDWQEVQNYIQAMNFAIAKLNELPLSTRLLRETHGVLLQGVRGEHKLPGEFRRSQNWIGGASLKDAVFVPPVHTEVPDLMSDIEKFMNNDTIHVPNLIRIAIVHYQFETIHPFLDGNGRIGRLLITLYLVGTRTLLKPALYLSEFFERNKMLYYDNLMNVRQRNNLQQWLKFFLVGVIETASKSIETFKSILKLKEVSENKIITLGKRVPTAKQLLYELFKKPVLDGAEVAQLLDVSPATANRLINDMIEMGIVKELTGYKRNRMYSFAEYLALFEK